MRIRYYALLLTLLAMTAARAQTVPGFTDINTNYRWKKGIFQDYMGTPAGPSPSLNGGPERPGALFYCTTDSNYYSYAGRGKWTVVGKDTSSHLVYIPSTFAQSLANSNVVDRRDSINSGTFSFGIVSDRFVLRSAAGIPWLQTDTQGILFPALATGDTTLFLTPDIQGRLLTRRVPLGDYYKRAEVDSAKEHLRADIATRLTGTDTLAIHDQIVALQNKVVPPPDLSPYLLRTDAAATYALLTALNNYLPTATAASIYAPLTTLNNYLLAADAANLYATKTTLGAYLTTASAASLYATQTSLNSYLLITSANSTYLKLTDATATYATQAYVNGSLATKLATTDAAATYATIASLNNYLSTATAASTYLKQSDAAAAYATIGSLNSYLLSATAASTYLKQTDASATYATIAGLNSYLLSATASSTYATIAALNSYLLGTTAASTYLKQTDASATYATIASLNNYLLSATAAATYLKQVDATATYYDKATIDSKLSAFRTSVAVDGVTILGNGNATPLSVVNDATHRFDTDTEKATWNGKVSAVGSSDIEITDFTKGIILRTSDGTRARITLIKTNGYLTLQVSDPL